MNRRLIAVMFLALTAAATAATAADLPPARWWRRPEVVQTLALTEAQQSDLDRIFRAAANELIDLKAETEKQAVALRGELDRSDLNKQNVERAAAKLAEARTRLFLREVEMLVDMRGALTDEQWTRLRTELENRRERQRQGPPPPRKPR
jgi:Spy/CpxP family protein refolding chaperone